MNDSKTLSGFLPRSYEIINEITAISLFFPDCEEMMEQILNGEKMVNRVNAKNQKQAVKATWWIKVKEKDKGYDYPASDKTVWFSHPWNYKVFKVFLIINRFNQAQAWKRKEGKLPEFNFLDIYKEYSNSENPKLSKKQRDEFEEIVEILRSIRVNRYIEIPEKRSYRKHKHDMIKDENLISLTRTRFENGYPVYEIEKISPLFDLAKEKGHIISVNEVVWKDLISTDNEKLFKAKLSILRHWNRIKYLSGNAMVADYNLSFTSTNVGKFAGYDLENKSTRSKLNKHIKDYLQFLYDNYQAPCVLKAVRHKTKNRPDFIYTFGGQNSQIAVKVEEKENLINVDQFADFEPTEPDFDY